MSAISSSRPKVPVWLRVLQLLGLLLVIAISVVTYAAYSISRKMPEAYEAWTTGNVMVDYLGTHTNQWPHGWADLIAMVNSPREHNRLVYTPIERLPALVKMDWHADVVALTRAALSSTNVTIRPITRPDGAKLRAIWGPDTEPNEKIYRYLRTNTASPQKTVLVK